MEVRIDLHQRERTEDVGVLTSHGGSVEWALWNVGKIDLGRTFLVEQRL